MKVNSLFDLLTKTGWGISDYINDEGYLDGIEIRKTNEKGEDIALELEMSLANIDEPKLLDDILNFYNSNREQAIWDLYVDVKTKIETREAIKKSLSNSKL